MAPDTSQLIEQRLPDNTEYLILPADVRAVAHALDKQAPNQRRGGPFFVIFLTHADALAQGRGGDASLDQLDPARLCLRVRATVDLHPEQYGQELLLIYDDRPDPLAGLRVFLDGSFTPLTQGDGLVPAKWVKVSAPEAATSNVPAYAAGKTYAAGYLVRYGSGRESFYYALQAGQLPAPLIGQSSAYWKLVPGPVPATVLSQRISLLEAQGIEGAGVVEARLYAIEGAPVPNVSNPLDGCWNLDGQTRTLYVRGFENYFDREGVLLDSDGVPVARVAVNVLLGTFERGLVLPNGSFQAKLRSNGLQLEGPADTSGQYLGLDLNGLFAFVTGGGLLDAPVPMGLTFGAQQSTETGERQGFMRLFGPHVKGPEPTDEDDLATKQYVDELLAGLEQLLAGKQPGLGQYALLYLPDPTGTLDASYFNKSVGVDMPGSRVLTLPTPTLSDVGKVVLLRAMPGYANTGVLTLKGPNPSGSGEDLAQVPQGGTALVQVVRFERGYPFSGQAAGYVLLASTSVSTSSTAGGAPQWVAGPQTAGALVFNAGSVWRVQQAIANGQAAPTRPNAYYQLVGPDDSKAPLLSPSFTGTPTAPTAPTATNSTQLATTAYVTAKLAEGGAGLADKYLGTWDASTNTPQLNEANVLRGSQYKIVNPPTAQTRTVSGRVPNDSYVPVANAYQIAVGSLVTGPGITGTVRVGSIPDNGTVTVAPNVTLQGGETLTFTPSFAGITTFVEGQYIWSDGAKWYVRDYAPGPGTGTTTSTSTTTGIDYANPVSLSSGATVQVNRAYYVTGSGYGLSLPPSSGDARNAIFLCVAAAATGTYPVSGASLTLYPGETMIVRDSADGWRKTGGDGNTSLNGTSLFEGSTGNFTVATSPVTPPANGFYFLPMQQRPVDVLRKWDEASNTYLITIPGSYLIITKVLPAQGAQQNFTGRDFYCGPSVGVANDNEHGNWEQVSSTSRRGIKISTTKHYAAGDKVGLSHYQENGGYGVLCAMFIILLKAD